MDGGAATATIEVLVQNLINVSKEEISLIRGLEKNADKLRETLGMMQSFMDDAQHKFITEESVKRWLKQLETASFDADNVLDELNYEFLSRKIKKSIESTAENKKIPSCFPFFKHYARRRQMALRVKDINLTFESINNQAAKLGLESRLANAPAIHDDSASETNSFTLDPIFVGRDYDVSEIVEMLTTGQAEQVVSVLPIVGMGGLGKTTLTRNVFHHPKIETHFGERIWVHVPKMFDPVSLLKEVLTNLASQKVDVESSQVILKKLQEALKEKTYLLVLDDVWNQDKQKWEDFKNSIAGISSWKGNSIVVTTRNTEVATIVRTLPTYELRGLPEDTCWSIIKAKAFGGGDIPPGYETIGRDVARRCQGLPLAANVVGSVLCGKSEEDWRSIKENWLSNVEERENNITRILKLSYLHLSSPSLKKCFTYCSIFDKGEKIEKDNLIELWMAEGFLQPDHRNDMQAEGTKFLNLLLQNSLLQVVERDDYDNITHCSMHDLVHDLAYSVLGHEYYGHEPGAVSKAKAKYLRTLVYQGEITDIIFSDFKSLHVLTLSNKDLEELPNSIKELIHLRYLNVSYTSVDSLPDSIGQLYHLQTLRARPKKLPSTLKYLVNLRHLHMAHNTELPAELGMLTSLESLTHFKVGEEKGHRIVELGSLQNLKGKLKIINLEKVDGEEEAKKACLFQKTNVVKLVLRWDERREGEIKINDENVLEGLQPHPNLKMLEIFGFKGASFPSWTMKMALRDDVKGRSVGLNNLVEIKLLSCSECEEIPMMGHLPHLKALFLSGLTNLKSIGPSFYGIESLCSSSDGVGKTIIVFRALKRMELSNMPNLVEWVKVESPNAAEPREVKVFPSLEYLKIKKCAKFGSVPSQEFPCLKELKIKKCGKLVRLPNLLFRNNQNLSVLSIKKCPKLIELPDGLHTLTSLKELTIEECPNLEELDTGLLLADTCGIKLTSLTYVSIWSLEGLVCLPHGLFSSNHNLKLLIIYDCPKLRELPDGLETLTSLRRISIQQCGNIKSIPFNSSSGRAGLASLRDLSIVDCPALMNLPHEMVASCAPSLEELTLRNLKSLMNLPMIIDCLHTMQSLGTLEISGVPKLIMTRSCTLSSLEELSLSPAASDSKDSFKSGVDGILQAATRSSTLSFLSLGGMPDWECLPDQIQRFTSVSTLMLSSFGIEELPEWFGHLTSLCTLHLMSCQKLRRLPSVKAMRRLTNLTELSIAGCRRLRKTCGIEGINYDAGDDNDDDYQWPNISHIPNIKIDGRSIRSDGRTEEQFQYLDGARK